MNDADRTPSRLSATAVICVLMGLLLAAYVGSFYLLSYNGYDSQSLNVEGYYFADPLTEAGDARHQLLCQIYYPMIEIDARLITKRRPGSSIYQFLLSMEVIRVSSRPTD
ncbi:hypothetical protein [Blastopirellula marina]|uniref:Uncharacterized protein n=1 Tax=Blastopirellula marina TaxID=124 RepID=A0A2S8GHS6_9BACT|nr:hypothetical protein [Blastopirellula marina]PQO43986.1 hypothetical protein C5Y93_20815 [Blastopirellula marina]